MEMVAVRINPLLSYCYYPKIITARMQFENVHIPCEWSKRRFFSRRLGYGAYQLQERTTNKFALQAVSPVVQDNGASTRSFEDFTVTTFYTDEGYDLKITAEVSGTKTQHIFDDIFSKMVADAQPIPGFRRVKGGKTPNIPKNILLEILGPSNVYEQVIKKVINVTIAEYVAKECLTVGKDLRVVQSFEELEAQFEPGEVFTFDAVISVSRLKGEQ
ncbi:uncharacterized protein LOC142547486 [Primulina tabacum]|uniref:uncharacterized protein LOC142547486 n=1 Tax=Primulina tabacum TaxID=48773 RepID=UPI003F5A4180